MDQRQTCCSGESFSAPWMEDVPMCRYSNPIPTCDGTCRQEQTCPTRSPRQQDQLIMALNCQNQLLVDILGAINSLTAAVLADHSR